MMDGAHYALALEFDTDSPDFVRGVEIGRLWEQLKTDQVVIQGVRTDNAEMVLRIADATGRPLHCEELNDEWLRVTFDPPT
jgi:hypothetical protein